MTAGALALLPLLLPLLVVARWVRAGWLRPAVWPDVLPYDFARHELGGVPVELLADALASAAHALIGDSRDFSVGAVDAWCYGVLVGWACEQRHEHDELCGGDAALREVAERQGWRAADVERLRGYRAAVAEITAPPAPPLSPQQRADLTSAFRAAGTVSDPWVRR
ncbi:hypothetical protein [Amycolatopsis solani]|uniref:hypothetical protein n=1 Tax=Amycolatopsis solani TaxID=3028615 RepID=UPI00296F66CE|nr:hypothetical protein [Amycolatopsis sp. MEP2-6]